MQRVLSCAMDSMCRMGQRRHSAYTLFQHAHVRQAIFFSCVTDHLLSQDLLEYDFHYAKLMIRWKEGGWRNKQMEVEFESPTDLSDFVQVIVKLHASVKIHSLG